MTSLTALRLYFPQSARAKPTRFWHQLSAPALSSRLMLAARRSGIHQALMHSVHEGYLSGNEPSYHHVEGTPAHHPLCIELIDTEERLRAFLHQHAGEMHHVRVVMFHCELVL
jgi:PII-like signaling protein